MAAMSFECDAMHADGTSSYIGVEDTQNCMFYRDIFIVCFFHVFLVVPDGHEMKLGFHLWTLRLLCCDELMKHVFAVFVVRCRHFYRFLLNIFSKFIFFLFVIQN